MSLTDPPLTSNPALAGSGSTGQAKAETLIEPGAAGSLFTGVCFFKGVHEIATLSFFGYFLLRKKNGAALLSALKKQTTAKNVTFTAAHKPHNQSE
ncbi:MAG TPA: hypothetical protein VK668_18625 [Mucilaginibacter sp.]|nr:hypothetical protein [Mucilaginibacter sp.]